MDWEEFLFLAACQVQTIQQQLSSSLRPVSLVLAMQDVEKVADIIMDVVPLGSAKTKTWTPRRRALVVHAVLEDWVRNEIEQAVRAQLKAGI